MDLPQSSIEKSNTQQGEQNWGRGGFNHNGSSLFCNSQTLRSIDMKRSAKR